MLYVYADESEQRSFEVFTVAAYVFDDLGLRRFEVEWKAALDDEGLTWFHMTDFENYKGEYTDWTRERHDQFIIRLIEIIRGTVFCGSACSLDLAALTSLTDLDRQLVGSPYAHCVSRCLSLVATQKLYLAPRDETTAWIFDDDAKGTAKKGVGVLQQLFEQMRSDEELRTWFGIGPDARASSRSLVPLQAADVLAYEAAKEAVRTFGRSDRPLRKSAERLFDIGVARTVLHYVSRSELISGINAHVIAEMSRPLGLEPPAWHP